MEYKDYLYAIGDESIQEHKNRELAERNRRAERRQNREMVSNFMYEPPYTPHRTEQDSKRLMAGTPNSLNPSGCEMDATVDALAILKSPAAAVKIGKIHSATLSESHVSGPGKPKADPRWERLSADVPTLAKMILKRADISSERQNITNVETGVVGKNATYQPMPGRDQCAERHAGYPMNTVRDFELDKSVSQFSTKSLQATKNVNHGSFRTQTARYAPLITFESEVSHSRTSLAQGFDQRIKGLKSTQREANSPNS